MTVLQVGAVVLLVCALTGMARVGLGSSRAWRGLVVCALVAIALLVAGFVHDFALRDVCGSGVRDLGCR